VATVCKGKKKDAANAAENMITGNVERGLNPNVVIVEDHIVQRFLVVKPKNKLQKQ